MTVQEHEQRVGWKWPSALTGERLFAGGIGVAGVIAVAEGLSYGVIRDDGIIGPGFLPVLAGSLLVLLSLAIIRSTFRHDDSETILDYVEGLAEQSRLEAEAEGDVTAATVAEGSQRSAVFVFVGIGVSLVVAQWLGLILALSALVFCVLFFIEKTGLVRAVIGTLVMGFGTWLVFAHYLEVPLAFGVFSPSY